MIILGFNCYGHDSSASLIIDGKLVFAVEEERLTRKKHDGQFPKQSIQACLDFAGITLKDVDHVCFFWKPGISIRNIPVYFFKFLNKVPLLLREQRSFTVEENLGMINYLKQMMALPQRIRDEFKTGHQAKYKFHYFEHHLCHAASTFYPSGYEDAAILTIDGAGEWGTCLLAYGKGNEIKKINTVKTPYSLGAFYQAISMHLGFKLIEGPGKMMALASYGNAESETYHKLRKLFRFKEDGSFDFDISYFSYYYSRKSGVSKKFTDLFGPSKTEGKNWNEDELNLAAAAQRIVEETVMHMVTYLKKQTGSENLCLAGGVALNSVTNGIIAQSNLFTNIFIQPAAGDSGTSLGSALYMHHAVLNNKREFVMEHAFWGNSYTPNEYENAIKASGMNYTFLGDKIYEVTANLLNKNYILAWFQDRMEFGPRALGNRSILTSPLDKDMKDKLNARVKFRESFRPFAAIVNEEDCGHYFSSAYPNPYMLLVYDVKKEYQEIMPAITHVDGTVRIQTVNAKHNPSLRKLLDAFKLKTGHSVLLNTSFNIKGEPIVGSPTDALRSYKDSLIDYLVIGEYLVYKGDQPDIL
jgi:carbamoyltransferase